MTDQQRRLALIKARMSKKIESSSRGWTQRTSASGLTLDAMVLSVGDIEKLSTGNNIKVTFLIGSLRGVTGHPDVVTCVSDTHIKLNIKNKIPLTPEEIQKIKEKDKSSRLEYKYPNNGKTMDIKSGDNHSIKVFFKMQGDSTHEALKQLKPFYRARITGLKALELEKDGETYDLPLLNCTAIQALNDEENYFSTIDKWLKNFNGLIPELTVTPPSEEEVHEEMRNSKGKKGITPKEETIRSRLWKDKMDEESKRFYSNTLVLKSYGSDDTDIKESGVIQLESTNPSEFDKSEWYSQFKDDPQAASVQPVINAIQWSPKIDNHHTIEEAQSVGIAYRLGANKEKENICDKLFGIQNIELWKAIAPVHYKHLKYFVMTWTNLAETYAMKSKSKGVYDIGVYMMAKDVVSDLNRYLVINPYSVEVNSEYVSKRLEKQLGTDADPKKGFFRFPSQSSERADNIRDYFKKYQGSLESITEHSGTFFLEDGVYSFFTLTNIEFSEEQIATIASWDKSTVKDRISAVLLNKHEAKEDALALGLETIPSSFTEYIYAMKKDDAERIMKIHLQELKKQKQRQAEAESNNKVLAQEKKYTENTTEEENNDIEPSVAQVEEQEQEQEQEQEILSKRKFEDDVLESDNEDTQTDHNNSDSSDEEEKDENPAKKAKRNDE